METLLISVIIPIYNAEYFLHQCIESILQQTYSNFEIICVDDGSTDSSLEICHQFQRKDSRVKVIHKDNAGVSSARNRGVACAQGQFVFFVDADDYLDKDALKVCLIHQKSNTAGTLIALNYDRVSKEEQELAPSCVDDVLKVPFYKLEKKKVMKVVSVRKGCYIWGMLIPKDLIDRYQLSFPEEICNLEDAAWIGMALCFVKNIVFIKSKLYHYRENPISITSNCVNCSWQAEHWAKVYQILLNYFAQIKKNYYRRIHIRKMLRYCKNNFYAECYSGNLDFNNANNIYKSVENNDHVRCSEYLAYKYYFTISRIINKLLKSIIAKNKYRGEIK